MKNCKLFKGKSYTDSRGYFFESFSRSISEELEEDFCQDNISFSHKGVVCGLHYQWDKPMENLDSRILGMLKSDYEEAKNPTKKEKYNK
jgi:dTDP-4-dehydrorhamnose 3,5-epimerase-like enzyme